MEALVLQQNSGILIVQGGFPVLRAEVYKAAWAVVGIFLGTSTPYADSTSLICHCNRNVVRVYAMIL
jgi:hypothetical protein